LNQIIELIVSPDGTSKIETKGFTGAGCQEASKFLESALGLRQAEKLTAEFYSQAVSQQQVQGGDA
jgi:hypothetical protein